jgi:replicative DNA helicase
MHQAELKHITERKINMSEYQLPYSIEAEKAVLGSMLLDNTKIPHVVKLLCANDFYSPENQQIFETVVTLHSNKKVADIVTVDDQLHRFEYLVMLGDAVTTTENILHYAKIVKSKSIRRQYMLAGQEIAALAATGEYDNIADFKNDVLGKMNIDIGMQQDSNVKASDILFETVTLLEDKYKNNNVSKLRYGINWLDKWTGGAYSNELTVLAARPSVGKTSLALQISLNMARRNNNVAIFSLEMGKHQLMERFISNTTGIHSNKMRTGVDITDNDWVDMNKAYSTIGTYNINIYDDVFKIEQIRSICLELKAKNELDYIIVDYLQLCDTLKKVSNTTERVTYLTRQFKLLNKELRVPILLLSQFNRANEADKRPPRLSDLRDSGSIEQDCDNAFFLHDEKSGEIAQEETLVKEITFIIAKQRAGKRDIATTLKFYTNTQRWGD